MSHVTEAGSCDSSMSAACVNHVHDDFIVLSEWAQENSSQDKQASVKASISKVSERCPMREPINNSTDNANLNGIVLPHSCTLLKYAQLYGNVRLAYFFFKCNSRANCVKESQSVLLYLSSTKAAKNSLREGFMLSENLL